MRVSVSGIAIGWPSSTAVGARDDRDGRERADDLEPRERQPVAGVGDRDAAETEPAEDLGDGVAGVQLSCERERARDVRSRHGSAVEVGVTATRNRRTDGAPGCPQLHHRRRIGIARDRVELGGRTDGDGAGDATRFRHAGRRRVVTGGDDRRDADRPEVVDGRLEHVGVAVRRVHEAADAHVHTGDAQ